MGKLDPDDSRPPYVQVADALRTSIASGALAPGSKLSSHQVLADRYGVSVGTVKRALGELQGAGLVISRQGQGAFVRTQLPTANAVRERDVEAISRALGDLAATVSALTERVDAVERRLDAL